MSLKRQAARGAYWMVASGAIGAATQLGTLVVLARILEPYIFGLVAMTSLVVALTQVFTDMGVSNAIIHRQDTTPDQLSSLYWLNIIAGVAGYLILVAATPLVVLIYSEPRLKELVPVTALTLLISPLGAQFRLLLQKNLRFNVLAITESIGASAAAGVAVAVALAGLGPYALIFGGLTNVTVVNIIVIAIAWREWPVRLTFQRKDLGGYISFGLYQMGERTANFIVMKLDQLLLGAMIGPQALGYYNIAANLIRFPLQRINPTLTRIAFPVFAKVQNDNERLKRGFMILRRILAAVNFPLCLGMAVVAPILVPVVFGEQWLPSVTLLQILSVVALLRSTGNPIGSLLLAKGRANYGFYWNLFAMTIQIPAVSIGAYFGEALGVAVAVLVAQCLFFCLGYFMLVRRLIGPCFHQYLSSLAPAGAAAAIMVVLVLIAGETIPTTRYGVLGIQIMFGAIVYLGIYWFVFRNHALEITRLALGRDAL